MEHASPLGVLSYSLSGFQRTAFQCPLCLLGLMLFEFLALAAQTCTKRQEGEPEGCFLHTFALIAATWSACLKGEAHGGVSGLSWAGRCALTLQARRHLFC